jgi:hypothetical protein
MFVQPSIDWIDRLICQERPSERKCPVALNSKRCLLPPVAQTHKYSINNHPAPIKVGASGIARLSSNDKRRMEMPIIKSKIMALNSPVTDLANSDEYEDMDLPLMEEAFEKFRLYPEDLAWTINQRRQIKAPTGWD